MCGLLSGSVSSKLKEFLSPKQHGTLQRLCLKGQQSCSVCSLTRSSWGSKLLFGTQSFGLRNQNQEMSPKARVSLKGDRALKPKLQKLKKLKTLYDLPVRKHQFPQGIGT